MWPRFGIKVGNSTLCLSYAKSSDDVKVVANNHGERTTPACLLCNEDGEIECGLTAFQKMANNPKQVVANSFQLLLPPEELQNKENLSTALKEIPCEYDSNTQSFQLKFKAKANEKKTADSKITQVITPFDVHVELFRDKLKLAKQYSNGITKPIAVLSIPSYYSHAARSELARSAENAGFHVAQIISESMAAVLAYAFDEQLSDKPLSKKYVIAIKCGGLFSYFAIYTICNGFYSQISSYGPFPVGGNCFTEVLEQFIRREFKSKYKIDANESSRSLSKIRIAATNCKHILTTLSSTQIYIDSLMDGIDFNAQMSRARFNSLIQPVISNFMQLLNECVNETMRVNPEITSIDSIVLLGATTQIPQLQLAITSRFPESSLHASIPTDEVVAIGCGRQTAFLVEPDEQNLEIVEEMVCVNDTMYIWHANNEENAVVLIPEGTMLPIVTSISVKACESSENIEIFKLRSENGIKEVCLIGATPNSNGEYMIEANILKKSKDSDSLTIRLRCQ